MSIEDNKLKNILEAALMAIAKPMSIEQMMNLFSDEERPSASRVKEILAHLQQDFEGRGIELKDVASGYRFQARQDYSEWLSRLWEEKPAKYSRASLETLALIAYRQPVTRAEIEEVRGVGVSSSIIKTMLEREWIRVVGHRDVPGRPSLYATTKKFLDYFNMKSLDELPSLAEIKDLDDLNPELALNEPGIVDEPETVPSGTEHSENVNPESEHLETVEAESLEAEGIEAESLAAESLAAEGIESESLEAESLEAESLEAEGIEVESLEVESLEAESLEAESLEAESLEAESIESESIEPEPEFNASEAAVPAAEAVESVEAIAPAEKQISSMDVDSNNVSTSPIEGELLLAADEDNTI